MKDKKTVVLDLTGCKSLGEMHLRIRDAFRFPDFYGQNWDAFWDLMRTECDAERIVVRGRDTVPKNLAPSVETLFRLLYTADGYFTQVIGRAGIEILDESPPADDEEDGRTEAEKNVVLDLTGCKSLGEMHLRI
ncbi:MAG: barstar family protein, partial [Acutalibacteraceae bacterium]